MKLNYQLNVINSKIDRLKKQSLLRTSVSVGNPKDERQNNADELFKLVINDPNRKSKRIDNKEFEGGKGAKP